MMFKFRKGSGAFIFCVIPLYATNNYVKGTGENIASEKYLNYVHFYSEGKRQCVRQMSYENTFPGLETPTWSVKWNHSLAIVGKWYIKTIASFSTPLT